MKRFIWFVVVLALFSWAGTARAQTATLFTSQSGFDAVAGATSLALPATTSLGGQPFSPSPVPFSVNYSCIANGTGIGIPTPAAPDGTEKVLVTAPAAGGWVCLIGPDWSPPLTNTNPKPTGPTIVANGEDDYLLVFKPAVYAVGLELLTNSSAAEAITLTFTDSTTDVFADSVLETSANTFEFVGFKSPKAIASLFVNTIGGGSQNEGISGVSTAESFQVQIDIKPGSDPNSINCGSKGVIPVGILTTSIAAGDSVDFDASTVDPTTVALNGVKAKVVGKKEQTLCHLEDVDADGDVDMVCQIPTYDFLTDCPSEGFGELTATTFGGAPISGTDSIRFVPDN